MANTEIASSSMNNNQQPRRGINPVPMTMTKASSANRAEQNSMMMAQTQPKPTSPLARSRTQWIEDLPLEEMQLCFDNFQSNYKEFQVLLELTLAILQSMDIIPLKSLTSSNMDRQFGGIQKDRFTEFDDDEE